MTTVITNRRWSLQGYVLLCLAICLSLAAGGQAPMDSILGKIDHGQCLASIGKKTNSIKEKLDAKSLNTLARLQKLEQKLYMKMLGSKDSLAAKVLLSDINEKYAGMRERLKNASIAKAGGHYIPKLDTLTTTLKFLEQNGVGGNIKDALQSTIALRDKFTQAEEVRQFIRERKMQLKEQLEKFGMVKHLKKFNKEAYYYSAQVKEYKEILKNSRKAEKKALELLSKTKLFKDFFRKNSQLASLFRIPGDPGDPSSAASLEGLQTRAQVNNLIQQQITAGGPGASQQVSQNIQSAQAHLTQLKDKVLKAGGNSSGDDIPDFKPNNQKIKSFWKRLEYGTNIQTQKANNIFPVTSDIGLSVGYKLNDKSVIGVGASYKIGWGNGWRDLTISHQGVSFRTYIDMKVKGSFWLTGGYEQNYRASFNSIDQLRDMNAWQQSGLIGISKVVSLKTKVFKKTKLQLLWDFLSYREEVRTQPLQFRIAYNFR